MVQKTVLKWIIFTQAIEHLPRKVNILANWNYWKFKRRRNYIDFFDSNLDFESKTMSRMLVKPIFVYWPSWKYSISKKYFFFFHSCSRPIIFFIDRNRLVKFFHWIWISLTILICCLKLLRGFRWTPEVLSDFIHSWALLERGIA